MKEEEKAAVVLPPPPVAAVAAVAPLLRHPLRGGVRGDADKTKAAATQSSSFFVLSATAARIDRWRCSYSAGGAAGSSAATASPAAGSAYP